MGDPTRGVGYVPDMAHPQGEHAEAERIRRENTALEELSRVLEALDRGETPEGNLAMKDEYGEFGLDKRVAYHYAALLIGGTKQDRLKRLSDTLPFGERQMREALKGALIAKLSGSYYDPDETSYIDWSAIANEDESIFSDEKVQDAISSYIDHLIETNQNILRPTSKGNPFNRQKMRQELRNNITGILNHAPQIANGVFTRMVDGGDGEMAIEVIENVNLTKFKERLSSELALKLQVERRGTFLRGVTLDFFSGLTVENLKLMVPDDALKYIPAFSPSTQNWIVNAYLSGRDQQGWEQEEFDKKLRDRLPEMEHLDQRALAVMRLRGFIPDADWTATLPPHGEGVAALLEVLDDPKLPAATKKSQEFLHAMDGIMTEVLDDKPVSRDLVQAVAFAREKYKVGPSEILVIAKHDPVFLEAQPNENRTGPAVAAMLRRESAEEKNAAGGPIAEWGWVDADSPHVPGNVAEQIAGRMEWFAGEFGWQTTLRFGNREGLTAHDAYMVAGNLEDFLRIHRELSPEDLRSLLDQVARDDVKYDGQPSQTKLRFVLDTIGDAKIEDIVARVEKINIPSLAERVARLRDDGRFHPYKTWKGMREFASVVDFLNKNKTLEQLAQSNAPESTKRFGNALLEHPNVPANEVLKFLTNPASFLSAEGQYTSSDAQSRMAPINLAQVERLGLSASEVRDAIADGSLDRLQVLPAFERTFTLDMSGADPYSPEALQRALLSALGRRERLADQAPEGQASAIAPKAREVKKLFAAVQAIFERYGIAQENRRPWLLGEAMMVPSYWSDALAKDLYGAVYDKKTGIDAPATFEIRARIGKKSDPSLIVAGNDTASCMPFGDGKTNVYSWSPACAQMVVERKMADGSWRTMAQSVVMPTLAGDKSAPERFSRLLHGEKVHGVFDGAEFARNPVILCDNVEPNPNEVQENRMPIIEAAYEKFFRSYLSENAERAGVDSTRVVVGKEDYLRQDRLSFPKTPNIFVPLAPISYTDNNATESYVIETGLPSVETRLDSGVREATGADIMAMAYMEGKGFHDNQQMVFGLYDRQQRVTAALISREQHGDPALTLISRDNKGEPTGYMLAYVGRTSDVPEVFIDDFAVDRSKNLLAARHASKLLDEFLDRYVGHYTSRGEPFPSIFAQMREDTSYKLMVRQLQKLSERSGIQVEMVEEGVSSLGGEPMHLVRIYAGKNNEDITEAKRRWNARVAKAAEVESGSQSGQWGYEDDEQADEGGEENQWDDDDNW